MIAEIAKEEFAAALETCAAEVLWEAGICEPPVDAFLLASRLGLAVACGGPSRIRGRFARVEGSQPGAGQGVILLASETRPERRHWAVAHEIGEFVAHRVFQRLGVLPEDSPPSSRELVANSLAGRLLLPRRWLAVDGCDSGWDLLELKQIYRTASHELIARRFLELIPTPSIVTIFDQGAIHWRLTSYHRMAPPLTTGERATWMACHESSLPIEDERLENLVLRTRCWPVHEPDWRREILLTELQETE